MKQTATESQLQIQSLHAQAQNNKADLTTEKSLGAREKHTRKSILISANKAGNTRQNLVITSIILRWVFTSALPGEAATCSHLELLYHPQLAPMAWKSHPRDPDTVTLLTGPGEELGLNASLCKVMGSLY